jgi:hypothetical protein
MPSLRSLTKKLNTKKFGSESTNNLLKFFLLGLLFIFGFSLFIFKFEILSALSLSEQARLENVKSLKIFLENPMDPIHGTLQWLSLKIFPEHHIFALRLPSTIMILTSISALAIALYLKFRNRYLPYIFGLLSITSPWLILLAHNGHIPGIDILLILSLIIASYYVITSSDLRERYKKLSLIKLSSATGLILLQPLGVIYFIGILVTLKRSTKFNEYIKQLSNSIKIIALLGLVIPALLLVPLLYLNAESWKILLAVEIFTNPTQAIQNILSSFKSVFGINQAEGLNLGTNRPDLLFTGALLLTIYEAFKKRPNRIELILVFMLGILLSAIYGAPTSILLAIPAAIAILSLSLANMIRIIDLAFPRNPYPKNIARTGMLALICTIATLGIYTTTLATIRENTPNKIDQVEQKRNN